MASYSVRPEAAGSLGSQTELDARVHPPVVTRLHYEFAGWSGDDIAESFPCFVVTQRLAEAIAASGLTGVEFDDVVVTKDPQFEMFLPDQANALPSWKWLRPVGDSRRDDFWQDERAVLHISERAREFLGNFHLEEATIVAD